MSPPTRFAALALVSLLACDPSADPPKPEVANPAEPELAKPDAQPTEPKSADSVPETPQLPPRGPLEFSMNCPDLSVSTVEGGSPVFYRTPFDPDPALTERRIGIRLPVTVGETSDDLEIELHLIEPTTGAIDLPIDGDDGPRATVKLGKKAVGQSATLVLTRVDDVAASGTLSLKLQPEDADPLDCAISFSGVPFEPFLTSNLMWKDLRLTLVGSGGRGDGTDRWTIALPPDVGGKLMFEFQGQPQPGTHELPTDTVEAEIESNDAAKVESATLTIRRNRFETYDADVEATVVIDDVKTTVEGTLLYMTTWKIRSTRYAEARDAVNRR